MRESVELDLFTSTLLVKISKFPTQFEREYTRAKFFCCLGSVLPKTYLLNVKLGEIRYKLLPAFAVKV